MGLALDTSEVRFADVVDEHDPARSPFRRPKASWQRRTNLTELRGFWESMGHRAQRNSKVR